MSSTAAKSFEIAIVGGGIAGLTLGIALHQRNIPVQLYEQTHAFKEIGAGVSFSPNAVKAMEVIDGAAVGAVGPVKAAHLTVATENGWESKKPVWFDYFDGRAEAQDPDKILFAITSDIGQQGVHRAHFLDELVKAFPADKDHFGKHLDSIEERADGKLVLMFRDGTTAEADAIVGCDGIHSQVRKFVVGQDHPSTRPGYSHKYAYRGLMPMEVAVEAIGEEKARNSCMFVSRARSVPIAQPHSVFPYLTLSPPTAR